VEERPVNPNSITKGPSLSHPFHPPPPARP
jgi:hypothetical protein